MVSFSSKKELCFLVMVYTFLLYDEFVVENNYQKYWDGESTYFLKANKCDDRVSSPKLQESQRGSHLRGALQSTSVLSRR
jgi:hypothetical protein